MTSEAKEEAAPFLESSLPSDDESIADTSGDVSHQLEKRWWTMVSSLCAGATFSSVLWLVVWAGLTHLQLNPGLKPSLSTPTGTSDCGSSAPEAIANDCVFQLWSYSWVPYKCFDKELHDEYLALRAEENWHYYDSRSSPTPVSLESVLTGTRNDLWSTWGQHFWHCAFYQRKFFRIVDQHHDERTATLRMTNRDLDEHHAKHCQKWLARPDAYPWDRVMVNLTVGYHACS